MARLKATSASEADRNLYVKLWDRARESLLRMEQSPPLDWYPKGELGRRDRGIVAACEAGEALVLARWELPRDHRLRDAGDSFRLFPDGRVEVVREGE